MNVPVLNDIISRFDVKPINVSFKQISQGFINDTYLVNEGATPKYILQRINSKVFKDIKGLHQNLDRALPKLVAKDYTQIRLFKSLDNESILLENENCWRLMNYIPHSIAHNFTSNVQIAFEAGRIIGRFHKLLSDENVVSYTETVTNLNFLPHHINAFKDALKICTATLKESALNEIEFALFHLNTFDEFYSANLPERICHNDTKLNNILFNDTDQGLCLIDLDTIMKGYFHYDFGDAVRTVVSETNEDEKKLDLIQFNLKLFENLIKGIKDSGLKLTSEEISFLPMSCALMPFMHGIRALTDYLKGNIYYKVSYPEQNLDRCKSLFRSCYLALEREAEIKKIVESILQ